MCLGAKSTVTGLENSVHASGLNKTRLSSRMQAETRKADGSSRHMWLRSRGKSEARSGQDRLSWAEVLRSYLGGSKLSGDNFSLLRLQSPLTDTFKS